MSVNPKVNILMVDDQPAKLLSYEVILSELGENLIKATSGREALEYLLKTDVAVVLMDVSMPELNGFELADMIRQHPRFQKTAIIFISAVHLTDLDRLKGYERGAVDYISVPVIPELLRAKVSVFAELHRKARQLETLNRQLEERVLQRTAEIRELNSELQQRVAELETIMQVLPMGVAVAHDPECRFITGNAALSDLMGMKQGDNLLKSGDGELPYDIYQNGQKLQPGEFPVQRAAANRELVGTVELEVRRRDGQMAHVLASANPLFDDSGQIRGAVGVFLTLPSARAWKTYCAKGRSSSTSLLRPLWSMIQPGFFRSGIQVRRPFTAGSARRCSAKISTGSCERVFPCPRKKSRRPLPQLEDGKET